MVSIPATAANPVKAELLVVSPPLTRRAAEPLRLNPEPAVISLIWPLANLIIAPWPMTTLPVSLPAVPKPAAPVMVKVVAAPVAPLSER